MTTPPMISERDRLSRTIREINHKGYLSGEGELQAIVDWVIADRARIVEPIIKCLEYNLTNDVNTLRKYAENCKDAMFETLKLAGLTP